MATSGGLISAAADQAPQIPQMPKPSQDDVATFTPQIAQAKEAAATGYDPKQVVVADEHTVSGSLKNIIDQDSQLMQQARTRAAQAANARGLINSSMAVGDAQARMVEAALPIAQGDAATRYNALTKNVDAGNAALNFEAGAKNQASLANAQLGTDVAKTNAGMINEAQQRAAQAANEQYLARLDATTRLMVSQLDANTKQALATLDADNRRLLQENQGAAEMYKQAVTNITNISTNNQMSKEAKDAAVHSQLEMLRQGLARQAVITKTPPPEIQSLDLSQYFDADAMAPAPPAQPAWFDQPPSWYTNPPQPQPQGY